MRQLFTLLLDDESGEWEAELFKEGRSIGEGRSIQSASRAVEDALHQANIDRETS